MDPKSCALKLTSGSYPESVKTAIDRAFAAMKAKKTKDGVIWFKAARSLAENCCDQKQLDAVAKGARDFVVKEAKQFRTTIARMNPHGAKQRVAIFSDSLGLPRPPSPDGSDKVECTFSYMLQQRLKAEAPGAFMVTPWCQRYLTTDGVLDLAPRLSATLKDAHVVIHVGLNDCANRIFQERERYAVGLLPKELGARVVAFGQIYRRPLIESDENYAYTPLPRFRANLDSIASICREHGAAQVIFTTVIMPPMRARGSTPHMAQNFTRYNLVVYDESRRLGTSTIDVDRLMWGAGFDEVMLSDGMHLASGGHRILADAIFEQIGAKG